MMICQILLALLLLVLTNALALQKHDSTARACASDDCHIGTHSSSQSSPRSDNITCRCCWQDCDRNAELKAVSALKNQRVAEDTLGFPEADAWLVMHCAYEDQQNIEWNMYTPIMETMKEALEHYGAVVRMILPVDIDTMMGSIRGAVVAGRRPLVVSLSHEYAADVNDTTAKMKEAKEAGAYLVAYQAEPLAVPDALVQALTLAADMAADEIWDYSWAHIVMYPNETLQTVRYLPPGYVRKLDMGVDLDSSLARDGIGYIGGMYKQMSEKYANILRGQLTANNTIWNGDALRDFLEAYPMQLNMHRFQTCCPRAAWEEYSQHVEAFRMATLLANKACVISAPSAALDMKEWESMINFVEVEETKATIERLKPNLRDCRIRSYEIYKREFAPLKLVLQSGLFTAWKPPLWPVIAAT